MARARRDLASNYQTSEETTESKGIFEVGMFLVGVYIFFYFASRGWKAGK
tara:strand:+ start:1610 stop:1759 length:150 start_codon:yes stop_codon:yes gene_type:complete